MKKIFTVLMALMLLVFTQCKPDGGDGEKVRVRCNIPVGNGTRSDFCDLLSNDSVYWSTGMERVYLAIPNDLNPQLVELTVNNSEAKANVLEFEGEVNKNLLEDGKEYEVWYFGNSKNLGTPYITETKDGNVIRGISGSIATQSGYQTDLGYCHIAKTTVRAKNNGTEIDLPLRGVLNNEMAIAYLELDNVNSLGGDAVLGTEYNFQYNGSDFEFVVTEDPNAKITVTNGEAKSFVVLFPNDKTGAKLECKRGLKNLFYEFKKGILAEKFYYRFISDMEKAPLRWEEAEIEEQDHEYVDMGGSVYWATYNIGATSPEEYGDYYAWGEITTKNEYTVENCVYYDQYLADFSGDPDYDAAAANWGGDWRMPTRSEMEYIANAANCKWTWDNQKCGYVVESKVTNNKLFFPAAGVWSENGLLATTTDGYYHTTTPGTNLYNDVYLMFHNIERSVTDCYRHYGTSIRPVKSKNAGGGGGDVVVTTPTVVTNDASNVGATSATCGGRVNSDGNDAITERGIYYGTSPNPERNGIKMEHANKGTGLFSFNLTGLNPETTYYVKAYATNSKGTSYGVEKTFTTPAITAPVVITNDVSDIQATSAIGGGNVTSDGGATVTARGVCWSTNQNPTISNSKTVDGAGTGSFTSTMTGLTKNTTYYVRAYATNSIGTSYGEQKTFTTVANDSKSIVFAEDVDISSGWYDVNKLKQGGEDINMCWAASASNIIQWWQDRYVAAGNTLPAGAVTGPGTKVYSEGYKYNLALMELYRDLWWNETGGDTDHGIVWYFEGRNIQATAVSGTHAQPNSSTSGGYFSSVWNQILPRIYKYDKIVVPGVVEYYDLISTEFNNYYIWGGESGLSGEDRLKKFSELVEEFIGRGPASFVISLNSNGGLLHATTLWGYEIDKSTGMITKLWITDSDDMHQSGNGDPTVQLLREYTVSYDDASGKVKLSGAPYGSCWAISLFPVSGYGTN